MSRKTQGQNNYPRLQLLRGSRAPQAGLSQIQGPTLLFPLHAEAQLWDRRPRAGRLGGLNWPPVPLARPAGLSTDPQAAGGWWSRRGLERAVGTHPLPNTPSTRPAPGKGRGGDQRDLDRGWGRDRRGKVRGCHYFGEGVGASWSTFPSMRRLKAAFPPWGCSKNNLGRTLGPWRAGVKEKSGGPGRLGE